MWTRHVLSKVEQAAACVESAILEADGEDDDVFEDLMVSLRRLAEAKKKTESLREKESANG